MKKAVFLDMDDTLCDTKSADEKTKRWLKSVLMPKYGIPDCSIWAERYFLGIYNKLNDNGFEVNTTIDDIKSLRVSLVKHLCNEQNLYLNEHNYTKIQSSIDEYRMSMFDFFPGVLKLLKELRKDYTLVVITNGPSFSQYPKLERVKLAKYVDHIIVGGDEPEQKPSPSIFYKALSLANVNISEAIHIGDSLVTDIQGARNLGITSVWINKNNTSENNEKEFADFIIPNVTSLPQILTKLVENHD